MHGLYVMQQLNFESCVKAMVISLIFFYGIVSLFFLLLEFVRLRIGMISFVVLLVLSLLAATVNGNKWLTTVEQAFLLGSSGKSKLHFRSIFSVSSSVSFCLCLSPVVKLNIIILVCFFSCLCSDGYFFCFKPTENSHNVANHRNSKQSVD